jgi:site-specific DNA-methyltransferase (cytosine-N4-specific)
VVAVRQFTILNADVMDGLRTLPDGSVQCCVTSPPYWGLRDYGTASWDGGDPGCDHVRPRQEQGPSGQRADRAFTGRTPFLDQCGRCGARRVDRQIGLEPTPEQYVERLVEVFREVRRVLRVDGVLWLNLGDCYHSGDRGGYCNDAHRWEKSELQAKNRGNAETIRPNRLPQAGLKGKDLVGIPWRVAFALQADGWWLRSPRPLRRSWHYRARRPASQPALRRHRVEPGVCGDG